MVPCLELSLLGGFTLRWEGQVQAMPNGSRLQAFLAYLALNAGRPQTRQRLAYLFWPDAGESTARNNLRQLLHQLRRAIPAVERVVAIDAGSVTWRDNADGRRDVAEFEAALHRAETAERTADQTAQRAALEQAISSYRGDLLPGCYDDWIEPERQRLRDRWLGALVELVQLLEEQGELDAAVGYAQQLVRHDPLDETAARTLMRLFAAKNDRARALRAYHACARALAQELGVPPSPETRQVHEQLLRMAPERRASGQPRAAAAAARSLIGRQREWGVLQSAWRAASNGTPRVALLSGEAGIGKSRLAEELATWARSQGGSIAATRGYPAEGQLSLAPVTNLLRSDQLRAHLARLDPIWLIEISRLLPELTAAYPSLGHPEPISEYGQRQRFFESLARAVLAAPAPLLLIVDDLQWCDQETIEWLHFVLRFDPRARLLLIGTMRADEISSRHPLHPLLHHLRSAFEVLELPLGPLDHAETASLAAQVTGRALDPDGARRLFDETEGNPLYVIEMVRAEAEDTGARANHHDDRPDVGSAVEARALPPRVHAVIAGRLAQVSEPAREILGLAAAMGREFRLDVLVQAAPCDEDTTVGALDELWHKRIIREQEAQGYDFTHDKLREVAYEQLSAPRRQRCHHAIARALELRYADDLDRVSGQIAAHYERAGLGEQAIPFYQRAAFAAQRVYAYQNAIALLTRARALLGRLPLGAKRDRLELSVQLALAPLYRVTRGWAAREVVEALDRALTLCNAVGDPHQHVQVSYGLQSVTVVQGKLASVEVLFDALDELHQRVFGRPPPRFARVMLIGARLHLGHFQEASEQFEEITAVPDEAQLRHLEESQGANYFVLARAWQSHALWCRGFPTRARQRGQEMTRLARDLRQPFSHAIAAAYLAMLEEWSAAPAVARAAAADALALAEAAGAPYYRAWAVVLVRYAAAAERPTLERIDQLRAAIDDMRATGAQLRLPYYHSLLARVWAQAGRITEGLVAIDEALADAQARDECWWNAELYRLRGAFLDRLGLEAEVVEGALFRAIEIARSQHALSLELRAASTLVRVRHDRPGLRDAREQLAALYDRFSEGAETPDLRAARDLLAGAQLGSGPA
jgi:DNA-binding SARP family transcriptional activator